MVYRTDEASQASERGVHVDAARRCVVRQRSSRWIKVRSTCLSPVSSKADALREHWAVAREHRGGRAGGEMWEGRRLGLNELARNARLAHAVPRVADNLEVRLRPGLRWRCNLANAVRKRESAGCAQAVCSSQHDLIGQTTSYRPCTMVAGMSRILSTSSMSWFSL